jgi:hypothetical protein
MYISGDHGVSWILKTGNVPTISATTGGVMNFTAMDTNAIIISSDFVPVVHEGLFISGNYGNTFSPLITNPGITTSCLISTFRAINGTMYLYGKDCNGGILFRSADFGLSWSEISNNLPDVQIQDLNEYNGKLYVTLKNTTDNLWEVWTTDPSGEGTAGIENKHLDEFCVYPNPASNELFVNIPGADIQKVSVFNASGLRCDVKLNGTSLNIMDLPTGVYFLELQSAGQTYREKFIKK